MNAQVYFPWPSNRSVCDCHGETPTIFPGWTSSSCDRCLQWETLKYYLLVLLKIHSSLLENPKGQSILSSDSSNYSHNLTNSVTMLYGSWLGEMPQQKRSQWQFWLTPQWAVGRSMNAEECWVGKDRHPIGWKAPHIYMAGSGHRTLLFFNWGSVLRWF